jgi:hypothetical protein
VKKNISKIVSKPVERDSKVIISSVANIMKKLPPLQVAKSLAGVRDLINEDGLFQQINDSVDQHLGKFTFIFNSTVFKISRLMRVAEKSF